MNGLAFLATVTVLVISTAAPYAVSASASPRAPLVTFTGGQPASLVCASRPTRSGYGVVGADDPAPVGYAARAGTVDEPGDPRGQRLLAVIAAICMLGVTTAIIRAIVSQRASDMVST